MSIYEAIFNRYSVREYRMEKIEPERLEALKRYLKTVALLDEEKPVEFEIVDNTDKSRKSTDSGRRKRRTTLRYIAVTTAFPCEMPGTQQSRQSSTLHRRNSEPAISERQKQGRIKKTD